ncbi:MAG: class I SAM-dependent methyltransferase [Gammaproteobacteria bacterium]
MIDIEIEDTVSLTSTTDSTQDNNARWSNQDNAAFYENVTAQGLQELAEKAGLCAGCDIDPLWSYIKNASSLLEVGAGYGRVIDALLKRQFAGKITALERSQSLFTYLQDRFSHDQVDLHYADILSYCEKTVKKFDVILFLWSGIADFPQDEQLELVRVLSRRLRKNGMLIIDALPGFVVPLCSEKTSFKDAYKLSHNNSVVYMQNIFFENIKKYARISKFKKIGSYSYFTDSDRERMTYILFS